MVRRTPVRIVVDVDTSKLEAALADLKDAEDRYFALVSGQLDCPAVWPHDPPGPDYIGTRCRLRGYDGRVSVDGLSRGQGLGRTERRG